MASATEQEVRAVRIPSDFKATDSFRPIRHGVLLDSAFETLAKAGFQIASDDDGNEMKRYTLLDDGAKMFGRIVLNSDIIPGVRMMIGLINSFNKTLAAKIGFGAQVNVCANGSIFAERLCFRKHTTHILTDLPEMMTQAIGMVEPFRKQQQVFFDRLGNISITDVQAHDFIIRAARQPYYALTAGEIVHVAEQWHNPRFEDFAARTALSLHNAFTDVYERGGGSRDAGVASRNGLQFTDRTVQLSRLFNDDFALGVNFEPKND